MLTLESDYSLSTVRARGLEANITARDLDGYFDHVWSVTPLVGADPEEPEDSRIGSPAWTSISSRHTSVEGRISYSRRLMSFPLCNFVLGQAVLLTQLDRLIRSEAISIVRASEPFYSGLIGLALARANRRPFVVRLIANYDAEFWAAGGRAVFPRLLRYRWIEKRIDRFVLPRADLVAAGSQHIVNYATANGAEAQRTTVFLLGNVLDPVHFEQAPEERRDIRHELGLGDRPFIIYVSRLTQAKHPRDVLAVLMEARREVPTLTAVLVGDGDLRAELEQEVEQLGLTDDVIFSGNRDQTWIAAALSSATVIVSPVTGRALIEGALSGRPIVAFDVDWQGELIHDGETGRLVPYRDIAAMTRAVVALVNDENEARALGAQARTFARRLMDPQRLIEHERAQYAALLERHAG